MSDAKALSDAYDCGAWARFKKQGRNSCPNYDDAEVTTWWLKGYDEFDFRDGQILMLQKRKGTV